MVRNQVLQRKLKNTIKLNQARPTKEHKGNDSGYCRGDFHESQFKANTIFQHYKGKTILYLKSLNIALWILDKLRD